MMKHFDEINSFCKKVLKNAGIEFNRFAFREQCEQNYGYVISPRNNRCRCANDEMRCKEWPNRLIVHFVILQFICKMIDIPVVSSIEIVKGREAKRCLFVLSPDLAPYLFREKKEDNKTSHLLYVALTRSLDHITILVMKEVENKYTRDKILKHFRTISIRE